VTGTPVGLLAGGAAVLLALGGALVYANRKRRTSFTA
jgi:LPXTG-motif cell wall-anchored protein